MPEEDEQDNGEGDRDMTPEEAMVTPGDSEMQLTEVEERAAEGLADG